MQVFIGVCWVISVSQVWGIEHLALHDMIVGNSPKVFSRNVLEHGANTLESQVPRSKDGDVFWIISVGESIATLQSPLEASEICSLECCCNALRECQWAVNDMNNAIFNVDTL